MMDEVYFEFLVIVDISVMFIVFIPSLIQTGIMLKNLDYLSIVIKQNMDYGIIWK